MERKKAENAMLDEVEHDILIKEKFISEQVQTLTEMQANMNSLIEHKNVLLIAQQVISGAIDPGSSGQAIGDEEAKRSSQGEINIPL